FELVAPLRVEPGRRAGERGVDEHHERRARVGVEHEVVRDVQSGVLSGEGGIEVVGHGASPVVSWCRDEGRANSIWRASVIRLIRMPLPRLPVLHWRVALAPKGAAAR